MIVDLLIKQFPEDLNHKLKTKALEKKITLKKFIIQLLTKAMSGK